MKNCLDGRLQMFKSKRKIIFEANEELDRDKVIDLYKNVQSLHSYLNRDEFKNLLNLIKEYKQNPENENNKLLISQNERLIYAFESKLKEYKNLLQQYNSLPEKSKEWINIYKQQATKSSEQRQNYISKQEKIEQKQKNKEEYEFRNSYNPNYNPNAEEMVKELPKDISDSFQAVTNQYENGYIEKSEFIDEIKELCQNASNEAIIIINNYLMMQFELFIKEIFPKKNNGVLQSIPAFLNDHNIEVLNKNISEAEKLSKSMSATFPVYPFSSIDYIESVINELKSPSIKLKYKNEYDNIINAITNIFKIVTDVVKTPHNNIILLKFLKVLNSSSNQKQSE